MAITLAGDDMAAIPTRDEVLQILDELCSGITSRDVVSAWAFSIINDDSLHVSDALILDVLKNLGAVDLPALDRDDYLYTETDFQDWMLQLRGISGE